MARPTDRACWPRVGRLSALLLGAVLPVLILTGVLAVGAVAEGSGPPPQLTSRTAGPIPPQALPKGVASDSAQSCRTCHATIYDEWRRSMHSAAWNDAQFQELWRATGRESACLNCHSPMAVQHRSAAGKANPAFQPTVQQEGVTCAACHSADGHILGGGRSVGDPIHPVKTVSGLAQASFCATCHQLDIPGQKKGLYDTYREWRESDWAKRGVSCQDCHMAKRTGNVATGVHRPYRSHDFRGAHSDLQLERALTVLVTLDKPQYDAGEMVTATVLIRNSGAGHHVPSGDPQHQIRVLVGLSDRRGKLLDKTEVVLARDMDRAPPYAERSDTRLAAGESRQIRFQAQFPGGLGEHYVVATAIYHLMPPETAHELGIPADAVTRIFHNQVIPITP